MRLMQINKEMNKQLKQMKKLTKQNIYYQKKAAFQDQILQESGINVDYTGLTEFGKLLSGQYGKNFFGIRELVSKSKMDQKKTLKLELQ